MTNINAQDMNHSNLFMSLDGSRLAVLLKTGATVEALRHAVLRLAVTSAIALTGSLSAHAQTLLDVRPDGFSMTMSAELRDEDNPFRLSPQIDPVTVLGRSDKSDQIHLYNIGLRFNNNYSLQRIELEANQTLYRYRTFDNLDFDATSYHAAWLWKLTPRLSGVLSTDRTETLKDYADFNNATIRNIQTDRRHLFSADWLAGADWHVIGALVESRSRNSESVVAVGDDVREVREAGVRYVTKADNSIALVGRHAKGRYEGRIADPLALLDVRFEDEEIEARVAWRMSGKSSLNARLGYLERRHEQFAQRDYSGAVGRLDYLWAATGRSAVRVSMGRHLFSYQEAPNSYYIARDISLMPSWQASEQVVLSLRLEHLRRDYRGAVVPVATLREDRIRSVQFGADWNPVRFTSIQAYWERTSRDSNFSGFEYQARAVGVRARLTF